MILYGNFGGDLGYNIHTRELFYAMSALTEVVPAPYDPQMAAKHPMIRNGMSHPKEVKKRVGVRIGYADTMSQFSGKARIGCTVWETTRLPPHYVPELNDLDEVWAVSKWGKKQMLDSGVTAPIEVVPEGVSPVFNPSSPKFKELESDTFKFVSVFRWEDRKAPHVLLRAFYEEFKHDPVELILQAYNPFTFPRETWHLARQNLLWQCGLPPDAKVTFVDPLPSHDAMAALYCSCDAFVLPTRGEGWCLPLIEAMGCGLPCVATDFGGQSEFFNGDVGVPVKYELIDAEMPPFIPYVEGAQWANPDLGDLRDQMRHVYEQEEAMAALGRKASKHVHSNFSWEKAAEIALKRVQEWQ